VVDLAADVAAALRAEIPDERIVADRNALAAYRGIAWGVAESKLPLSRPIAPPLVAVQPRNVADVCATLQVARTLGACVVPYGSGTGVQGGASPLEGSIVIDLGRMDGIRSISRKDRSARVEPGVLLGALDAAANEHGLMVGHDPWSQPIASVGGAVSTNGVGYLAGKYGPMGSQVLGLEVVLADGCVVRTKAVPKASVGPSLQSLFIGAEGVFGVITEVDVQLFPVPERRELSGYRFANFEAGLRAVVDMFSVALRPSMIDFEEDEPARGTLRLGSLVDLPSPMYLAFEGFAEEVAAQRARADEICLGHGGARLDPTEVQEFWDTRHSSAERWVRERRADPLGVAQTHRVRRWTSAYVNLSLPVSAILEFRRRAAAALAPCRLAVKASGLWGMPELYSVRFEHQFPDDPRAPDELDRGTDLGLQIAQELGGSMEYCHGVGVRLSHLMASELGTGLELLRRLKQTLDPNGLLNPGKLAL